MAKRTLIRELVTVKGYAEPWEALVLNNSREVAAYLKRRTKPIASPCKLCGRRLKGKAEYCLRCKKIMRAAYARAKRNLSRRKSTPATASGSAAISQGADASQIGVTVSTKS